MSTTFVILFLLALLAPLHRVTAEAPALKEIADSHRDGRSGVECAVRGN